MKKHTEKLNKNTYRKYFHDSKTQPKMYTENKKERLVKEAQWKPNLTMIFAGIDGKTWHSYNSTEQSNRITLNLFIKRKQGVIKSFYP